MKKRLLLIIMKSKLDFAIILNKSAGFAYDSLIIPRFLCLNVSLTFKSVFDCRKTSEEFYSAGLFYESEINISRIF